MAGWSKVNPFVISDRLAVLSWDLDLFVVHRRVAWMLFYAIFWVIVFWLAIHVLHHACGRLGHRSPSLLPAPFSSSGRQVHNVILGVAHFRVETTRYNEYLSELPFVLDGRLRSPLKFVYNGGGLLGVVGMIGSVVVLLWQAYDLIFGTRVMRAPVLPLVKRNAEPQGDAAYLHSMVILIIKRTVRDVTDYVYRSLASPSHLLTFR